MTTQFNFTSSIKDIQNRIVSSTIKEVSNLDLLKSEEAIKAVIRSYTDRFRSAEGMLTNISKYVAQSKEVIKVDEFNNLFESLYIDLAALYNDLELVDNVLSLNLGRNKNYFLVIKKRVRDLWQRLELTRMQVYDLAPSDESFYESFYSAVNSVDTANVQVDRKNGFISLQGVRRRLLNDYPYIKTVSTTTYPVENQDGGVLFTTDPLNDINASYTDGEHDLLSDGLWKEQVLCKDVPNMVVNIGSDAFPIRRNYRGVVSIVDIEYAYPIELNRLDIDVFGEKVLDIDCLLYKLNDTDEWSTATFEAEDPLEAANPIADIKFNTVSGRAFDVISFLNIKRTKIKHLRLVFNQQNYSLLDTDTLPERSLEDQVNWDLSERRYELVKFHATLEEKLRTPVNEGNLSLYSKVISVIESTRNIEVILSKINDILIPPVKSITTNFSKTAMFEIGAWSIEPMVEEYTRLQGRYDSKSYKIRDKNLISVQLKTSQEVPSSSTCNWYIGINGSDLPIMENDEYLRKEPFYIINSFLSGTDYSTWPGSFILLDFPIDPTKIDMVSVFENGIFNTNFTTRIAYLNSRLLYLPDLTDPFKAEFVIRYPVAKLNCVNLYALNAKSSEGTKPISLGIVSSRREILEFFINLAKSRIDLDENGNSTTLSTNYTISNTLATIEEAQHWFGYSFMSCIFIDDTVVQYLDLSDIGSLSSIVTIGISKLGSSLQDAQNYYSDLGAGPSDFSSLAVYPNVAPLTNKRII